MSHAAESATAIIQKESLVSAGVNLVINAGINAWMLAGKGPHVLTVDSIGSSQHTVFGSAVPLAVILSLILSTITFFTFRKKAAALDLAPRELLQRPYFFFGLKQAATAAFVMFGVAVAAGVIWQRLFGTLTAPTEAAALIAGIFAGLAAWYACSRTSRALLRKE